MYTPAELEEMKWSSIPENIVVFDTETTGLNPSKDHILEIGAVKFNKTDYRANGEIDTFQAFIKQENPIPHSATKINGITDEMVKDGDTEIEAINKFLDFVGDYPLYAYNQEFDMGFLFAASKRNGIDRGLSELTCTDLLDFSRKNLDLPNYRLGTVCEYLEISSSGQHRAVNDSLMSLQLFIKLTQHLVARDTGRAMVALEELKAETEKLEKALKARQAKEMDDKNQSLKTVAIMIFIGIGIVSAFFLTAMSK